MQELDVPVGESVLLGRRRLAEIACDLRSRLPDDSAVLPSEPAALLAAHAREGGGAVNVDAFLFDEEDEERLVREGRLSRAFCRKCGSRDTEMLGEPDRAMQKPWPTQPATVACKMEA